MFWQVVPCLCRASRSEQQDVVSPYICVAQLPIMHRNVILPMSTCASNKAMKLPLWEAVVTKEHAWHNEFHYCIIKIKCLALSSLQSNTENIEVQTVPLSSSETVFGAPSELVIAHRRKWIIQSMDTTEETSDYIAQ